MNEAPRREGCIKRVGGAAPRGHRGAARPRGPGRLAPVLAAATLFLAACGTMTTPPPPMPPRPLPQPTTPVPAPTLPAPTPAPTPVPPAPVRAPLTPPHVEGREGVVRVALLLPFSSRSAGARAEAASMLEAAQLALFEAGRDHVLLIPKDTAGTAEGGRSAAESALRDGADVILGPLFADAVRSAGREAERARVPVIAFSNDRGVARPGAVYLLGRTPEEEVERIVGYAAIDFAERGGVSGGSPRTLAETFDPFQPLAEVGVRFGALTPDDAYGERVAAALQQAARAQGGSVTAWQRFPSGDTTADELTPAARALAQRDGAGQLPYDAVLLPEGGVRLLSLAPLLPFYNVDPRQVRFLGTSLWADPSIAREPSLDGGLFPAPDPAVREPFVAAYRASFGGEPSRLSGLAYDAVRLVAEVTAIRGAAGLDAESLGRPDGFDGVEGRFRFRADGTAERALAVMQIRRGRFEVVDPAPQSFSATGW